MGGIVHSTPECIQHATIHRLCLKPAQSVVEMLGIGTFELLHGVYTDTLQVPGHGGPDPWDLLES